MKKLFLFCFSLMSIVEVSFSQWNVSSAINTPVCVQPNNQHWQKMVTDSKGGVIIVWEDERNALLPDTSADIYVQRLDKNGFAKWTVNGVNICGNDSDQSKVAIIDDGFGGAIISWNDLRAGDMDVYAQRVDSSGNILWTADGVAVSGAGKIHKHP